MERFTGGKKKTNLKNLGTYTYCQYFSILVFFMLTTGTSTVTNFHLFLSFLELHY